MMEQPTPRTKTVSLHPFRPRRAWSRLRSCQAGFSLIELVIIIVIMGVLTVLTIPRFNYAGSQVAALSKKLVEDLRYAQGRAVATQIRHGLIFSGCSGGGANCTQYRVAAFDANNNPLPEFDASSNPTVKDPVTGLSFNVQMTGPYDGVVLSTTLTSQTIQFDPSGTPCGGLGAGCVKMIVTPLPNDTITVQKSTCHLQVTVTPTTGLVGTDSKVQCS